MNLLDSVSRHIAKYDVLYFLVAVLITITLIIFSLSDTILISGSQFNCTSTDAVGVKARCTQFTMKDVISSYGRKNTP